MIEWLILLLVVPAVVVPAVLLAGFAGCGFTITASPVPKIDDAVGTSIYSITLTVDYEDPSKGFQLERKKIADLTSETFTIDDMSTPDTFAKLDASHYRLVDQNLEPDTLYLYRVRPIFNDGNFGNWSNDVEPDWLATTKKFRTAFEWTPTEKAGLRNAQGWAAFSFVQRIEAPRLTANGDYIRLTLRSATDFTASIERVYVSRAAVGAGSDPYDPEGDLTAMPGTPVVIPMNDVVHLTAPYQLNHAQALLVAIDFGAARTEIIATDPSPVTETVGYQKPAAGDQAALPDRTGFTQLLGIRLLEKIEVG